MNVVLEFLWPATLTDIIVANVVQPIASTNQKTSHCIWFNPNEIKVVYLRCTSGEVSATAPLGLSPKKVGDDIAEATSDWKGLRITVKLTIQNRQAQIEVVPSASALIIKALKEPPRNRKKQKNMKHSGNITFDDCQHCPTDAALIFS
uniref:Ribosomal protein L12 n=1 Tax=Myotis myotis TaxID=51298 RepID=A0A7J7XH87_MYOMY|nr:hypothetical protein mMyoMyo1_011621 [Myotis myotis]